MREAAKVAYEQWLAEHMARRTGERLRRLKEGHAHAERMFALDIWWPVAQTFEYLHPEYEIRDFNGGFRFLDFAYLRQPHRFVWEVDGFGPHARDLNRRQFSDSLIRQNHLVLDDWKVFRFSYDSMTENPQMCRQMIQQMLGKWYGLGDPQQLPLRPREILRIAGRLNREFTVKEVCEWLGVEAQTARRTLRSMLEAGYLEAGPGLQCIRKYRLAPSASVAHSLRSETI